MTTAPSIALISHRFGNIGHTFMAVGMEEIARQAFGDAVDIVHFEQHRFFDLHPWYHPLRWTDLVRHGRLSGLRMALGSERACRFFWPQCRDLRSFAMAINCGGPSVSPGVGSSPEMRLMFLYKLGAFFSQGIPVLDLGVGSGAFPIESPVGPAREVFSGIDLEYFQRLFAATTLTTVRDPLAQRLLSELGRAAPLIPCAALIAGRRLEQIASPDSATERKLILINFQKYGANEDWGQSVDPDRWASTVRELIQRLSARHEIAFLCHNTLESKLAETIAPHIPRHLPNSVEEYARLIRQAKAGLVSRIHAAIPLAGIGIPSLVIGTDCRLGTIDVLGLPTHFVKEATVEYLEATLETLLNRSTQEAERLRTVREETATRYAALFREHARVMGG